jgi:hypothetical protein
MSCSPAPLFERFLQRVPAEQRTFHAHRKFADTGEGAQITQRAVARCICVAVHHAGEPLDQARRFSPRFVLEQPRHHRDRGLRDRAAVPDEASVSHAIVNDPKLECHLVAAARIVHKHNGVRVRQLAAVPRILVVLEDQLLE